MTPKRRLLWTLLIANFSGALLTVGYFRFLHPAQVDHSVLHSDLVSVSELLFFAAAFSMLALVGLATASRWALRAGKFDEPLPNTADNRSLRQWALRVPANLTLISLFGWFTGALIWAWAWPTFTGTFALADAVRHAVGLIFVMGPVVAIYIFLATERHWREQLPWLMPDGELTGLCAPRLGVHLRLTILFIMLSLLPILILSIATIARAEALMQDTKGSRAGMIWSLISIQVALGAMSLLVAMRLANFVTASVVAPIRQLVHAMGQVQSGKLDVHCPVVSNDELGEASEGFNHMVAGLREREVMRETFGKYVSPEIRDEILSGRVSLEGGLRNVSILFADLRGFTTWVENSRPADVVSDLNAYFSEMDAAIRSHDGLVLQFIGDEIEAVFGAPIADARQADKAVAAALAMQARLEDWNAARGREGKVELRHGIGIHSGDVVAGNIGSDTRMAYSLVGDVVNVASRIQALNKELGTNILVSAQTCAQLTDQHRLGQASIARVRGRREEVAVISFG